MRKVGCKELKFRVILKLKEKYHIKDMCKFFEVSRSGYYSWLKKLGQHNKDNVLYELIKECQIKSKHTYGYRRVTIWLLRTTGLIINHKAVLRIMNKYGLLAQIRRRRRYVKYSECIHKYENLFNREFKSDKPNMKWVTDISYIHTKQGILYLSIIKDLYDNFIVAYDYSASQNIYLVINTIKKAKEKVANGLTLHSDQGFQYTSHAYFNLIKEYDITPSMSRRGNCLDNACAENFFSIIKSECISRIKPKTLNEAKEIIDEYIYFYNYERIQLKTKLTPYEKRCQLA